MKVYIAQSIPKVGALDYNASVISQHYTKSIEAKCDICAFPELFLTGYIPSDLLLKDEFIDDVMNYINAILKLTKNTTLLLTTPYRINGLLYNTVIAMQNGSITGISTKENLPNYGVFDEKRYFSSGKNSIIMVNGVKIGVPICEDIWTPHVIQKLKQEGAEIIIVPNASPFESHKASKRLNIVKSRWEECKLPILYCNQVLGLDGITYDGCSFGYDGKLKFSMQSFSDDSLITEVNYGSISENTIYSYSDIDLIYGAIVLGVRNYFESTGFEKALIGVSGGIDSALVTAIAADALGAENVSAVLLPSNFTTHSSFTDAEALLNNIPEISKRTIDIKPTLDILSASVGEISSIAYENLQARIRGTILMTISNTEGELLLTTGNKSEIATGYCTLYGDMCGAFNPIKDLYKTMVWEISRWRNKNIPKSINVLNNKLNIIPESIISKEPSAELKENQKDSDTLPDYHLLDQILNLYIEKDLGEKEIIKIGFDKDIVKKIINLVNMSEYKRWQSAPGVKVTSRSFIKERRYPISVQYSQ